MRSRAAPDSSAIAKLGANDPIDSRPASERLTAKGQVQVELGYVQRGRNREPAAARMWASTARRTSRTSFSSHGPSVAQLPNPVTHCARTCCDVRWGGRRVAPTMTYQMNSSRYLAAVCARRSRAAPAAVSQAELVRRWRPDGPRPAADPPGGRVWRADGSSSRALPRELRSPGRPTLTGASGHELRLDGLACAVGDPMPADDAGGSTTSRLEPPDARVLWFRAHRLGFRASLDVRFATGARLLSLGHCVVARRCPGATWLCCVRIRSVGARHRSRRGSRDRRLWPAWCTSRRRRSCALLLAGPSRIASWVDGRQRSRS